MDTTVHTALIHSLTWGKAVKKLRHIIKPSYLLKSFHALYNIHTISFISLSFKPELLIAIQTHCNCAMGWTFVQSTLCARNILLLYITGSCLSLETLLSGRRQGWDVSREQHQNMYIIKGETDHQPRLDA